MALTETPNTMYSSYSCNACGISSQVLVERQDENGGILTDENFMPLYYNDDAAASAEINFHIETEHPPPGEDA